MTIKQLQARVNSLIERLETTEYTDHYTRYQFEANVKVRASGDIDKVVAKVDKRYQERAREWLEANSGELWWSYVEQEGRYFIDDYLKGCTLNSREWQREHNETDTPDEAKLRHALDIIEEEGLYGRCGGHFCFNISTSIDDLNTVVGDLEARLEGRKDDLQLSFSECIEIVKNAEHDIECAEFLLEEAKAMVPNDESFNEEYLYRVEEMIEEWDSEAYCVTCHQLTIN